MGRNAIKEIKTPDIFHGDIYTSAPHEAPVLTKIEATSIGTSEEETMENNTTAESFRLSTHRPRSGPIGIY